MTQQTQPAIICLVDDLFFSTRLVDVITAMGARAIVVETPDAFVDAMNLHDALLALLDLATPGNWQLAIQRCKTQPETKQTPIYAFGSHVDTETLRKARKAGADHAWARSKMMEELVALVTQHIHPAIEYPEGWEDAPGEVASQGFAAFNRGEYFEQHEFLEEAWKAEKRPIREMYQGILQVGLAFLQIERSNQAGAIKMFRRGLPKLRNLPTICQGIQIDTLRNGASGVYEEIKTLGEQQFADYDRSKFPKIVMSSQ